jgi:hypothetical protein
MENLLFDPLLGTLAENVNDLEKVRIANQNRLRQLTRDEDDVDGTNRGFALPEDHPAVMKITAIVEGLEELEALAVKALESQFRVHPLYPLVNSLSGLGSKQTARLLYEIGDPYWNTLHDRPRTLGELWAYCGLHVVDGVAPEDRPRQRSNWNHDARTRAWLIAQSCVIHKTSDFRPIYDAEREYYRDAVHTQACKRCGPKGHPAAPGSPLSDGHKHARAVRAIMKGVLRQLWEEARRIHEIEQKAVA